MRQSTNAQIIFQANKIYDYAKLFTVCKYNYVLYIIHKIVNIKNKDKYSLLKFQIQR